MDSARETNSSNPQAPIPALVAPQAISHHVPLTLAPFILAPEAASLLPTFNVAVPTSNSLLHHLPPNVASLVPDFALQATHDAVQSVLNTSPSNVPLKYVDSSPENAVF